MSHYVVAVIHRKEQVVDEMLEPFYENLELEFMDKTEEINEDYQTETVPRYRFPDGSIHEKKDVEREISKEEFKSCPDKHLVRSEGLYVSERHKYLLCDPEYFQAKEVEVPVKEIYSFEEYATDVCGYSKEPACSPGGEAAYGYYYNPQAKWDWWEIGGRWEGFLKKKNGTHCNTAMLKEIDFFMNEKTFQNAIRWWEVAVDGEPLQEGEDPDQFRSWYKTEYLRKRYGDKTGYATEQASFSTYAVLTPDGEWLEPGEMGWFGVSGAEPNDEKQWHLGYRDMIQKFDQNLLMTIVDCHI